MQDSDNRVSVRICSALICSLSIALMAAAVWAQQSTAAASDEAALANIPSDAQQLIAGSVSAIEADAGTIAAEIRTAEGIAGGNSAAEPDLGAASPSVVVPKTASVAATPDVATADVDVASAPRRALVQQAATTAATAGATTASTAATAKPGAAPAAAAEIDGPAP